MRLTKKVDGVPYVIWISRVVTDLIRERDDALVEADTANARVAQLLAERDRTGPR